MRRGFVSLTVLLCCVLFASVAQAITLVKDGKPAATIVIAKSALEAKPFEPTKGGSGSPESKIHLAAVELQNYVKQMSGAELPIVAEDAAVSGAVVLVGPSAKTQAVKDAQIPSGLTKKRREDGFVIHAKGDTLVLAGNDAGPYHGTHYAVAEFLNRQGVRWFMPGEFGEVVPRKATVEMKDGSVAQKPTFPMRTWWSNQTPQQAKDEAIWMLRNKMNLAGNEFIMMPGDSSLADYMPDPELIKTKPELFARTWDGKPDPRMPNMSNEETAKIAAEKVIAKLRAAEQAGKPLHSIGFAPDDGLPVDHTPETMRKLNLNMQDWNGREGVPTEVSTAEEWFFFMNRVAEHVAKEYPDVILTTNGYVSRANPPEGIKPHKNIGLMYACIWADNLKPLKAANNWHGEIELAQIKRFTEMCEFVFIYEYNLTMIITGLTPVPTVQRMAQIYKLYADYGLYGFNNEARAPYMEEGIVSRYVRARLMWDPNQDLDKILDDYYGAWYGPAASQGRAFWTDIEQAIIDSPMLGRDDNILPHVYTPKLLASLEKTVAEAEKRATEEPFKTRVRVDRLTLEHLKAYMAAYAAEMAGNYAEASKQYQNMIDRRGEISQISQNLVTPTSIEGIDRYVSGEMYFGAIDRRDHTKKIAESLNGTTGNLIAMTDTKWRFTTDDVGRGRDLQWYLPGFDRSKWKDIDTSRPFYLQHGMMSADGIPHTGRLWYVTDLDVPADAKGKTVKLFAPVVVSEAWVWVNGEFAGHRPYKRVNRRPQSMELDVTNLIKPGQKNTIAIWVNTGRNPQHAPEGLIGRVHLYSPTK